MISKNDKKLIRDYVTAISGGRDVKICRDGIVRSATASFAEDVTVVLANARRWEKTPIEKRFYG